MAIFDERDAPRGRLNIDDIVERDSSSTFIVLIVLAVAIALGGWYVFSLSDISTGPTTGGVVTTPPNAPAVPNAS